MLMMAADRAPLSFGCGPLAAQALPKEKLMAISPKIKVMVSSRCKDPFSTAEPVPLTDIRRDLKASIESARLFDLVPFEVWINEDTPALDHSADSWEACMNQARACDVMIVLYNGHAGWAKTGEDIGVCHAEYAEAVKGAPTKVRLIELPAIDPGQINVEQAARNARFKDYQEKSAAFRGGEVQTVAELKAAVHKALFDAVLTQTRRGGDGSKGARFDRGEALEWSRLDFAGRRAAMEGELTAALAGRAKSSRLPDGSLIIHLDDQPVLVRVHAVPAAFSTPAAREPVGQPHLRDHGLSASLKGVGGPVHFIACHRGVTETQATNLLGFPDATVVSSPFGVYAADDVQKMQFVFLANCRDVYQTRYAVQRFLDWADQTGENKLLAARAQARARIVRAIAKEQA